MKSDMLSAWCMNLMFNLRSFTGENCRNFLYVAPSNERGKFFCFLHIKCYCK